MFWKKRKKPYVPAHRYELENSEVTRGFDQETRLFYYVQSDYFVEQNNRKDLVSRIYYTRKVDEKTRYEEAKASSISFKFTQWPISAGGLNEQREAVQAQYLDFDYEKTGGLQGIITLTFADGSKLDELTSYKKEGFDLATSRGVGKEPQDRIKIKEYSDRGTEKLKAGDANGAITNYTQALYWNPTPAEDYFNRGVAWQIKKDLDRAIVDYTKAIEVAGDYSAAYVNRGFCWQQKGDHNQAIDDFSRALEINPRDSFAQHNRGISWQQLREYDLSINDFDRAIELNPNDALSFYSRCGSWTYKGDHRKALSDIRAAVRLRPDDERFRKMAAFLEMQVNNEERIFALYRRAEEEVGSEGTPICGPYSECDFVSSFEEHILLASWGFVNSMGPTFVSLCLSRIHKETSYLIFLKLSHPFVSQSTVYGLMPHPPNPGLLRSAIEDIFSRNGGKEPILRDAPSFILLPQKPPIDELAFKDYFYLALKRADIRDLERFCLRLKRYWCNQWERAADERDYGFEILSRTVDGFPKKKSDDNRKERRSVDFAAHEGKPINRLVFGEWWSLVTHPENVKTELNEIPRAWQGAVDFQNQISSNPLESIELPDGLAFHYRLCQANCFA